MASQDMNIEGQRTDDEDSDEASSEEEVEETSSGESEDKSKSEPVDLKSRLAAFLPELEKANEELKKPDNIEKVEDGEQYIEMNLGLGVLEETNNEPTLHRTESDESDESDESEDEAAAEPPTKRRKIQEVEQCI